MRTYHFVVGDWAARPLLTTFSDSESDKIIVLKDILNVGPLLKQEGQSFTEMRIAFWQQIVPNDKSDSELNDLEQLLAISKEMFEQEDVRSVFWMAPLPADICAYYWLLFYLSKHKDRFQVINIAGLPFLNETGKLFFPKSIAELSSREIQKATKLARAISASEIEVDVYEWKQIVSYNAAIRTTAGGKKINHHSAEYYDQQLLAHCGTNFQRANKIIQAAMGKDAVISTGDLYLAWRLRTLAANGQLIIQGDNGKSSKEPEYRLPQPQDANISPQEESVITS